MKDKFYIGQTFTGDRPPQAAAWCNSNNAHIERIDGVQTIVANPVHVPTKKELIDFVTTEADKVAYGGITIIANEQEYLFKTTTDNITRCNSVLAMYEVLPDDTVIPWEVWQGDTPVMLPVNKAQFKKCFAFGASMIIEVETAKGMINANIQKLTDEQLADPVYIAVFKENTVIQLEQINTVFKLDTQE